jgi:hypothetical protein
LNVSLNNGLSLRLGYKRVQVVVAVDGTAITEAHAPTAALLSAEGTVTQTFSEPQSMILHDTAITMLANLKKEKQEAVSLALANVITGATEVSWKREASHTGPIIFKGVHDNITFTLREQQHSLFGFNYTTHELKAEFTNSLFSVASSCTGDRAKELLRALQPKGINERS